jgi:hypothetical protein
MVWAFNAHAGFGKLVRVPVAAVASNNGRRFIKAVGPN